MPKETEIEYNNDGKLFRKFSPNWLTKHIQFDQASGVARTVEGLITARENMVKYIELLHDELDSINQKHKALLATDAALFEKALFEKSIDENNKKVDALRNIVLTKDEVQCGYNRVKWAEGLILQLPKEHESRNSWLLNYGRSKEAMDLRDNHIPPLGWDSVTNSVYLEKHKCIIVCPLKNDIEVCKTCLGYKYVDTRSGIVIKYATCGTCKFRTGVAMGICMSCNNGSRFYHQDIPESNDYQEGN